MVVETAPANKRGFYGALPQMGVPIGLLLSTAAFALASRLPNDQFLSWGWRVPFLISIALIGIGLFIRLRVIESPLFERVKETKKIVKAPFVELLRSYPKQIVLAIGTRLAYGTQQLGLPRDVFLNSILAGCAIALVTLPLFGKLSDIVGRRTVYLCGAVFVMAYGFLFFRLVETKEPMYIMLAYVFGIALSQASTYGVQSTWFAELFGTRVRYTGASLPYQIAGIITSGPAPLISAWLFATYANTAPIALYIAGTGLISFVSAYFLDETFRSRLEEDHQG
jgi:MFS family permease